MKKILKKIVIVILKWEAKLVLKRYRPKIIAITGSVGKTSSKDAIFAILSKFKTVRKSNKSYNSEIGLPLTILGLPNGWNSLFIWAENVFRGLLLFLKKQSYPEYLILEVGVGKPGDITKNIAPWLHPDIVVITRFPEKPVHVEFFKSVNEIIEEKSALAYAVRPDGVLVLNHDDDKVYSLHNKSTSRTVSFGERENATYRVVHPRHLLKKYKGMEVVSSLNFKLEYKGNTFPVILPEVIGLHYVTISLAAIAVACEVGCDLLGSIEAIKDYRTPPGRLSLIDGINGSVIIDDTYNSSPIAAEAAVEVLAEMKCNRKIAVLGDMLELGKFTEEEHKILGEKVASVANLLVLVGPRSKFIAEGAINKGFQQENIYHFNSSLETGNFLKNNVQEGDIVLMKGSQGIRLEKAVEAIMEHPELKEKLLCRQEKQWKKR